MSESDDKPFVRTVLVDEKPLVGSKWWNESMGSSAPVDERRRQTLFAVGGLALLMFAPVCLCSRCGGGSASSDEDEKMQKSLELQQNFGWSFGAEETALVFDGASATPYDPTTLATLAGAVEPKNRFRTEHRRTLFDAADASPKLTRPANAPVFQPLRQAMKPHFGPSMDAAYQRGLALASLFETPGDDILVVIDLPGPDAVAFAAGFAQAAEPIFTFDNWPHPLGVVPAHQTLASVVYYRPLFQKAAATPRKLSAFVLDRNRLAAYADDGSKFDNRYIARLPAASALTSANVKHVLYVAPDSAEVQERDDLNDDFVGYERAGIDVRVVASGDFNPDSSKVYVGTGSPEYHYGGSPDTHWGFWGIYGWRRTTRRYTQSSYLPPSSRYRVTPRATSFPGISSAKTTPTGFGHARVNVSRASGLVTSPSFGRSGSYGRSSGGFWGS